MTTVASAGAYLLSTPVELGPNAGHQARREAGAQRTLYAVACMPVLGVPVWDCEGYPSLSRTDTIYRVQLLCLQERLDLSPEFAKLL
jgi:hypothetical protein